MISTAIAIQNATGDAVTDISTMIRAKNIYQNKDNMTNDEFAEAMFEYSAHLASVTATLVIGAVMSKSDIDTLLSTINEIESMGNDIE
jgi:hypothetical protein